MIIPGDLVRSTAFGSCTVIVVRQPRMDGALASDVCGLWGSNIATILAVVTLPSIVKKKKLAWGETIDE